MANKVISDVKKRKEQWQDMLLVGEKKALGASLSDAPMVEVAEFIEEQDHSTALDLFLLLDQNVQAELLGHFHEELQHNLYKSLPKRTIGTVLEKMASDLRADFYLLLEEEERTQLLPYLSKRVRKDIITLSGYSSDKAGGIMSTDFVMVENKMTAAEALDALRQAAPSKRMMYYLYVVDEEHTMIGTIELKELILAPPSSSIDELIHDTFVYGKLNDDREDVAKKIEKYDLLALPILNDNNQLVGIVSYDDALEVIRAEQTEDMERFMGIVSGADADDNYLHTSSTDHFKKRVGWVSVLFILGAIPAILLHFFNRVIDPNIMAVLTLYLPVISDTGGNVGSQAATVVVRALSLGQLSVKNWLSVLYKELKIASFLAVVLFVFACVKVYGLQSYFEEEHGAKITYSLFLLACTIATAISIQVLAATLIGAALPLLIKAMGKDPALAASPAITTLVDFTGILFYFLTALVFLQTS